MCVFQPSTNPFPQPVRLESPPRVPPPTTSGSGAGPVSDDRVDAQDPMRAMLTPPVPTRSAHGYFQRAAGFAVELHPHLASHRAERPVQAVYTTQAVAAGTRVGQGLGGRGHSAGQTGGERAGSKLL